MKNKLPFIVSSGILIAIVLLELSVILNMNHGLFVYTLDDAYIHLSMAENILHGTYGINSGEFASAASSILWPFLLSLFTVFPFSTYSPLVLNIIFSLATLFVLGKLFSKLFLPFLNHTVLVTLLLIVLIPATGMVGLIFTGMEHSLQIFSVVLVLYFVFNELHDDYHPRWLLISIMVTSMVRYENITIALFAIAVLFVRGRKRLAISALFSIAFLLASFSLFIFLNEGSFLPTSVVAKIGSFARSMAPFSRFGETISTPFGMLYLIVASIVVFVGITRRHDFTSVALSAGALFVTLLDLLFGKVQYFGDLFMEFGYFFRYEMYLWMFLLVVLIVLLKDSIGKIFRKSIPAFILLLCVSEIVICGRNNLMLFTIPTASNNIYEQHAQMHLFAARFYRGSIAVNDIGYVSYQNDEYVLDLWGLTSKRILNIRKNNPGKSGWIDSVVTEKKISLAIVYDVWYTSLPAHWTKVAEMTLTRRNITASENVVSFYAVDKSARIVDSLIAFRKTMFNKEMLKVFPPKNYITLLTIDSILEHTLSGSKQ